MAEEGRLCGDAGGVMSFYLAIHLAVGDFTWAVGRRSNNRLAGREFDTPVVEDKAHRILAL